MYADFVKQQQGKAEKLSKSRKKFLATMYEPLFRAQYIYGPAVPLPPTLCADPTRITPNEY